MIDVRDTLPPKLVPTSPVATYVTSTLISLAIVAPPEPVGKPASVVTVVVREYVAKFVTVVSVQRLPETVPEQLVDAESADVPTAGSAHALLRIL